MPEVVPGQGDRQALPVQQIGADGMRPGAAVLVKEMIFAIEVDQSVRIAGGTANRRIMIGGTVGLGVIVLCIRHISILKDRCSLAHGKSRIPARIRAVGHINGSRLIAVHEDLNPAAFRLDFDEMTGAVHARIRPAGGSQRRAVRLRQLHAELVAFLLQKGFITPRSIRRGTEDQGRSGPGRQRDTSLIDKIGTLAIIEPERPALPGGAALPAPEIGLPLSAAQQNRSQIPVQIADGDILKESGAVKDMKSEPSRAVGAVFYLNYRLIAIAPIDFK
ncbi:hypothetical protein D3C75_351810 [compost metagenome]